MKDRQFLILSGVAGLAASGALFGAATLLQRLFLSPLVTGWLTAVPLVLCLALSVAEMPMMTVALRKIATDPKRKSPMLLAFTNTLYVSFAAVYAALFVLLTGKLWMGAGLSALAIVRFGSSLIFVVDNRQI